MCKSGCYINEQCMNHVMYEDNIIVSSGIKCHWHVKFVCVVFKFKSNKLYCPTVSLDCDMLEYSAHTKYSGFTFSMNVQDDDDRIRQM